MLSKFRLVPITALVLSTWAGAAVADLRPLERDTWYAALGGYWVFDSSTQVTLGDPDVPLVSASLDLTRDLAVDRAYAGLRFDGYWRFSPRHRVELSAYQVNRSGNNVISEDISFEDQNGDLIEFNAGAQVGTAFDIDVLRASYLYSFYRSDRVELGFGAGLYGLDLSLALEGEADVNGVSTGFRRFEAAGLAPLPVFSFRLDYSPADRWTVRGAVDQFFISTGDFKGSFNDFKLVAEHQTFRSVALGFGFNRFQLSLEIEDTDYLGDAQAYWQGAVLYAAYRY
jgi:hypothetical protein